MRFKDIISHRNIIDRLVNLVENNRIPHAILLEGPAGIGKFSTARALAQYIHCENRMNGDSCGVCPSCLQHQSFNHIDTHYVFPVVKKGNETISDDLIDEWKEFLSENPYMPLEKWIVLLDKANAQPQIYVEESAEIIRKLSYTSHKAKYKIILLWLPERMKIECANKLLKLIEEPHEDTLFILVSNDASKILPTIYSRTQRFEMKRLSDEAIANELVSNYSLDYQDALSIGHIADGSMIAAEKCLNLTKENQQYLQLFIQLMRLAYQRKIKELKQWSYDVATLGRDQEIRFLTYCQRLIRENFIYNINVAELNYLNRDEAQFSANFARFITERNVEKLLEVLNNALTDIAGNANGKIVLFDVAIKVILLLKS